MADSKSNSVPSMSEILSRAARHDQTLITEDVLKACDGQVVWMFDDYLSMRNIDPNPGSRQFLDRVFEVKSQARANGVTFSA